MDQLKVTRRFKVKIPFHLTVVEDITGEVLTEIESPSEKQAMEKAKAIAEDMVYNYDGSSTEIAYSKRDSACVKVGTEKVDKSLELQEGIRLEEDFPK